MLISRNYSSLSQIINPQSKNMTSAAPLPGKAGQKFQNILKDVLPNVQNAAAPSSSMTALGKEQLMLFSRALQIQMNSRLYNTVFNNSLESNILASQVMQDYGNRIARHITDASNIDQKMSKIDTSTNDPVINEVINQAAEKYDIDANLIRSVIKAESNFNPSATSPRGAMGLMQLMPETANELGVKNAYDPRENVMGGARYLKMLLSRYDGQVDLALAAYNWGMGNVEKKPDRLPAETLSYIDKVNSYYQDMKA